MMSNEVKCPVCETVMETDITVNKWFRCPKCDDLYYMSKQSRLEKRTVNPSTDLSQYPEVVVEARPPFCDCEVRLYLETLGIQVGPPRYCEIHNVISLAALYSPKDVENIDKAAVAVLIHESLHWLLGWFVCKSASYWLDNHTVYEFLEDCYNYKREP
jgi:hypothetical protein